MLNLIFVSLLDHIVVELKLMDARRELVEAQSAVAQPVLFVLRKICGGNLFVRVLFAERVGHFVHSFAEHSNAS